MLVLPVAIWGWRLITHRPFGREWLRALGFWIGAVVLASAFASCLPRTVGWPLPAGMGGVTGDAMLKLPLLLFGGHPPAAISSRDRAVGILARSHSVAVVMVAGFWLRPNGDLAEDIHREAEEFDEDEERASISLGWLVHAAAEPEGAHRRSSSAALGDDESTSARAAARPRTPRVRTACACARTQNRRTTNYEDEEEEEEAARAAQGARRRLQPDAAHVGRRFRAAAALSILRRARKRATSPAPSTEEIEENAESLESVLEDFGVKGEIINARPGPVVTLYELEPAPGIKSSRVIGLADDIARSMSAVSARVAVVPGPQRHRHRIAERSSARRSISASCCLERRYNNTPAKLPLCLGKTIGGEPVRGRSRAHAASADRRHHRLRQVGRDQHHAAVAALQAAAGSMPADHDRSEDARTFRL